MKKNLLFACLMVLLLSLALTACGGDDATEEPTVDSTTATGTLVGFADNHTVEVTMEDGTAQTFLVYDEEVLAKLEEYDDQGSQEITFGYTPKEGQDLQEIVSVE